MMTIFCYINQIQGPPVGRLLADIQKQIYFNMYIEQMANRFQEIERIGPATINMIRDFMLIKQQQVEKKRKKD